MDRREWLRAAAAGAVTVAVPAVAAAEPRLSLWEWDFRGGQSHHCSVPALRQGRQCRWLTGEPVVYAVLHRECRSAAGVEASAPMYAFRADKDGRIDRNFVEGVFQRKRQQARESGSHHRWLLRTGESEFLSIDTRTGLLTAATAASGWE